MAKPLTTTELDFLELLRAGIYGTTPRFAEKPGWKAIYDLAEKHRVTCVCADAMMRLPADMLPGPMALKKLRGACTRSMSEHSILNSIMADAYSAIRARGLDAVVLKGPCAAMLYPNPLFRQSGDLDIYAGSQAEDVVKALEQHWGIPYRSDMEVDKHLIIQKDDLNIEVHYLTTHISVPWRNKRYQQWAADQLRNHTSRATIGEARVTVPSHLFNAIFFFQHSWHHLLFEGLGMRQLCDWALTLAKGCTAADRAELGRLVQLFGMERGWKILGYIAVNYLGVPEADMPLYDPSYRRPAMVALHTILDNGNFGHHSTMRQGYSLELSKARRKLITMQMVLQRLPMVMYFAPLETIFDLPIRTYWAIKDVKTSNE